MNSGMPRRSIILTSSKFKELITWQAKIKHLDFPKCLIYSPLLSTKTKRFNTAHFIAYTPSKFGIVKLRSYLIAADPEKNVNDLRTAV